MKIIVIGSGPAGGVAATLLARAGADVTLIEQGRFPRDKVCGECISALGRDVLKRHRLDAVLPTGRELVRAHLFGRSSHASLDLPAPMLGLSRAALDTALLESAVASGARLLQPARVEGVDANDDGVVVRVRCLVDNVVSERSADYVFAADGRGNFVTPRPPPNGDIGVKTHFEHVDADPHGITLFGNANGYGGVAPIEGDRWNVAFALPRTVVANVRGDIAAWWESALQQSPVLRRQFGPARRVTDWLAAPLPRHSTPAAYFGRVIPIGAAAWAIEPVGGEGMGSAMRLAEMACEAVLADRVHELPKRYATVMRNRGLFCRLGGRMMADADGSDAVAFAGFPLIGRLALTLIGK